MAIVEVHHGQGQVERVTVSREQPLVFGSSPKCDIVLDTPGIQQFHGRIRWEKRRYKVDASSGVDFLEVDGKKVKSSSFYQGSEITVGSCRIFMLNDTEGKPRDDRTRLQAPPKAAPLAKPPATPDWLSDLQVSPPSSEIAVLDEPMVPSRFSQDRRGKGKGPYEGRLAALRAKYAAWRDEEVAPGQERVISSPLVVALVSSLVLLLGLGFSLWYIIGITNAQREFDHALSTYDDADYRNAITRFDRFATKYPEDERNQKARVYSAFASVRQFAGGAGPSWANAIKATRDMIGNVGDLEPYQDVKIDLADVVLQAAEGLSDRAKSTADPAALAEAEGAVTLHAELAGQATKTLYQRSKVPKKLGEARAAVLKSRVQSEALAAMDQALKVESVNAVYTARDALVARYSDLTNDRQLVTKLTAANEILRRNVVFDPSSRPAETITNPDPLGPPLTWVLRTALTPADPSGPMVFALVDGMAFGLDGRTGAPLWQLPVGLSSPFSPQALAGRDSAAIVVDAKTDELLRIESRTGNLVWRQSLGESVDDPPLVLGNQIIQTLPSGGLMFIDLETGQVQGTLKIGRQLTRSPVVDEAGQFLYVLGRESNLFVIARDSASCVAVEYLGHALGSLPSAPGRLGRFLIVPENHLLTESRWRVFLLEEKGAKLQPSQVLPIKGWTWSSPSASGSTLWAVGDRGGASAYAIGPYESRTPFTLIADMPSDARSSGPAYVFAKNEREAWVSSGRSARLDLNTEAGKLSEGWTLASAGPSAGRIQQAAKLAVLTQQVPDGPGIGVWGVDPETGKARWHTVLGSPWPVPPVETESGGLLSLATDGKALELSPERVQSGGFFEAVLPTPGTLRLVNDSLRQLTIGERTVIIPSPDSDSILVRQKLGGDLQRIELPAPLGATPIAWGEDLFIPGGSGRAYLIDSGSGASRAEPFVPSFDRSKPTQWKMPVLLDGDGLALADASGRLRRFERPTSNRPRLSPSVEVNLTEAIVGQVATTGKALVVVTSDQKLRSLSARDFSPIGAWDLSAPVTQGPASIGGYVFLADASGTIHCLAADGRRLWAVQVSGPGLFLPPFLKEGMASFLAQDGQVLVYKLDDGTLLDRVGLGVVPSGAPLTPGDSVVIPVGLGSLRTVRANALAEEVR